MKHLKFVAKSFENPKLKGKDFLFNIVRNTRLFNFDGFSFTIKHSSCYCSDEIVNVCFYLGGYHFHHCNPLFPTSVCWTVFISLVNGKGGGEEALAEFLCLGLAHESTIPALHLVAWKSHYYNLQYQRPNSFLLYWVIIIISISINKVSSNEPVVENEDIVRFSHTATCLTGNVWVYGHEVNGNFVIERKKMASREWQQTNFQYSKLVYNAHFCLFTFSLSFGWYWYTRFIYSTPFTCRNTSPTVERENTHCKSFQMW